jgi:hypothetical protein
MPAEDSTTEMYFLFAGTAICGMTAFSYLLFSLTKQWIAPLGDSMPGDIFIRSRRDSHSSTVIRKGMLAGLGIGSVSSVPIFCAMNHYLSGVLQDVDAKPESVDLVSKAMSVASAALTPLVTAKVTGKAVEAATKLCQLFRRVSLEDEKIELGEIRHKDWENSSENRPLLH